MEFSHWRELIDGELTAVSDWAAPDCSHLRQAVGYILSSGGKRLRGLLVLSLAVDLGQSDTLASAVGVAAGLECVHAASLVHDDLPALDNDDVRRGKPSCHRAFDEATAILVGDLLVGAGFSCVARSGLLPAQQSRLLELLSATWMDLCVGQALDLKINGAEADPRRVMQLKTGALFGCATGAGAVCAGLQSVEVTAWIDWGTRLGILFQRVDDVIDGDALQSSVPELLTTVGKLKRELTSLLSSQHGGQHTLSLLGEFIPAGLQHSSRHLG